jgi:hypothetical protein
MRYERFEVTVTFDERRGYIASAPDLRQPRDSAQLGRLEVELRLSDVFSKVSGTALMNASNISF